MNQTLKGKDYISTQDWSDKEIETALETAADLKQKFKNGEAHRHLPDKTIFLFFFDKSTRTRNSFEAGITQLGGHAHFVDAGTSQIAHGESAKDTGIILSSYRCRCGSPFLNFCFRSVAVSRAISISSSDQSWVEI